MKKDKLLPLGYFVSDDELISKRPSNLNMTQVAKKIKKIGRNKLYELLREKQYLGEDNVAK